ncbi:MAG TPA: glycosyltransferase family 4 protein [Candidatus Synoicihabitans sp.]|nr:glycosyltransferase family 4 protein [Candidatus Synoicihabitans sp.]
MKPPIVLVCERWGALGGAELYLRGLAEAITQRGHDVTVLTEVAKTAHLHPGVTVEELRARGFGWMRQLSFHRRVTQRLASGGSRVLSTLPLAGTTHYLPATGVYARTAAASARAAGGGFRTACYHSGNQLNLRRYLRTRAQRRVCLDPHGPRILTFSHRVAAHLTEDFSVTPSRILTVPLGVSLPVFHPRETPPPSSPRLRLLFIAQNYRLKGLAPLLRALGEARRTGLEADLAVVGSQRTRPFKRLAQHEGVGDRVSFVGRYAGDVAELYRRSDVLVHPTYSDHCSLVVVQAIACGLPLIVSREDGASELITSGRHGVVLDSPDDIPPFVEALRLLADAGTRERMRLALVPLAEQVSFETHADRVTDWLTASP